MKNSNDTKGLPKKLGFSNVETAVPIEEVLRKMHYTKDMFLRDMETVQIIHLLFTVYDAADTLLREFDRRIAGMKDGVIRECKKAFNDIQTSANRVHFCTERFGEVYGKIWESNIGKAYTFQQLSSDFFLQSLLRLSNTAQDTARMEMILRYLDRLKSSGTIRPETMQKLRMK